MAGRLTTSLPTDSCPSAPCGHGVPGRRRRWPGPLSSLAFAAALVGCGGSAGGPTAADAVAGNEAPVANDVNAPTAGGEAASEFVGRLALAELELSRGDFAAARAACEPLRTQFAAPEYGRFVELSKRIDAAEAAATPAAPATGVLEQTAATPSSTGSDLSTAAASTPAAVPAAGPSPEATADARPPEPPPQLEAVGGVILDGEAVASRVAVNDLAAEHALRRVRGTAAAADALDYLTWFLARHEVPDDRSEEFEAERERVEEAAAAGEYRNGSKWQSKAEYEADRAEAARQFESGVAALGRGQFPSAVDALSVAARMHPADVRAAYLAGLVSILPESLDLEKARDFFSDVLDSRPSHTGAYHNMGLIAVKQGHYGAAARYWQTVAELDPASPHLKHNVARLLDLSAAGHVKMNASERRRIQRIVPGLTAAGDSSVSGCTGWAFMPLSGARHVDLGKLADAASPYELTELGHGTGFVVGRNLVLTNRHVVRHRGEPVGVVKVARPGEANESFYGRVLAYAEDRDVALLEVPGLDLPALRLRAEPARRSEELMVFGYPLPGVSGRSLKATRGVVVAGPSAERDGMFTTDASASPGNSGGPVVGRGGAVIGLLTAKTGALSRLLLNASDDTFAVPSADALSFLQRVAPHVVGVDAPPPGEWPDVDAAASRSVVMLTACDVGDTLALKMPYAGGYTLEDHSCPACYGSGHDRCRNCVGGSRNVPYKVQTGVNQLTGRPITALRYRAVDCPSCRGGTVPCTLCRGTKYYRGGAGGR